MTMASDIRAVSWFATVAEEVCVCGIGARTPLGFGAAASAAAVRGAISAIALHPSFLDRDDEPIALACAPGLAADMQIDARLGQLLVSAVAEALGGNAIAAAAKCWIGLPEARPGLPADIEACVTDALVGMFARAAPALQPLARGHAAGLMAMQLAASAVASGELEFGIAAGVDSYCDLHALKWLDRKGRLMSARNRSGFPPGEAAGACLLARRSTAERHGLPVLARMMAATTAVEPHPIRSGRVCVGEGLSAAIGGAAARLELPRQAITATYCDLNGERYRTEEFMYTLLRVQEAFVDAHAYQCPADCWGDVGAASGLLFASLAIASWQRGYASGAYPMLWASSNSGQRSAVILALGER